MTNEKETTVITADTSKALDKNLTSWENKIRNAQKSFLIIGEALNEINNNELYIQRGFTSFETYCDIIFDMSRNYAYKCIAAYRIIEVLKSSGFTGQQLPRTESQCRPLTKLNGDDNPEYQRLIVPTWEKVLAHDCRITAKLIETEVNAALGKGEPEPKQPVEPPATPGTDNPVPPTGDTSGNEDDDGLPEITDKLNPEGNADAPELPELPEGNNGTCPAGDAAELAFLRCKVADLENKLALERMKKGKSVPNTKIARDIIQAGFKAIIAGLDDEGKKEALEAKKQMLGL